MLYLLPTLGYNAKWPLLRSDVAKLGCGKEFDAAMPKIKNGNQSKKDLSFLSVEEISYSN